MTAATDERVVVVIAAHGTDASTQACIDSHLPAMRDADELIVVSDSTVRTDMDARVRWVPAEPGASTPALWTAGIHASDAPLIRLTIAPVLAAAGWRAFIADAADRGVAAAGGPIAAAPGLRLRDWAVLFLRYHRYLPPLRRHVSSDVPGDHAYYARAAIETCAEDWAEEFWENEINQSLAATGHALELDPSFGSLYAGGESTAWFLDMRWSHGVRFGRTRAAESGAVERLLRVVVFVLPGAVFLAKIVRAVVSRGGYGLRLALALPWLLVYLGTWAVGEWWGWLLGPAPGQPHSR